MRKKCRLSIISVNLNNLEGLKRTMQSVFNQTWQEFEYIIIDGGSTDGSTEYISFYKVKIDYWVSESDTGIYNGMNKGIKAARGEYLLFLNSGDYFYENTVLEKSFESLKYYDLIYFNLNVITENDMFIKKYPEKLYFSFFIKESLPHPATFIKAVLFQKSGLYDENFKITADWKFFVENIYKFNASYKKVDAVLSSFSLDGLSSKADNIEIIREEKMKVLRSNLDALEQDSDRIYKLESLITTLRNSRKIRLLVKLGLLNKF